MVKAGSEVAGPAIQAALPVVRDAAKSLENKSVTDAASAVTSTISTASGVVAPYASKVATVRGLGCSCCEHAVVGPIRVLGMKPVFIMFPIRVLVRMHVPCAQTAVSDLK